MSNFAKALDTEIDRLYHLREELIEIRAKYQEREEPPAKERIREKTRLPTAEFIKRVREFGERLVYEQRPRNVPLFVIFDEIITQTWYVDETIDQVGRALQGSGLLHYDTWTFCVAEDIKIREGLIKLYEDHILSATTGLTFNTLYDALTEKGEAHAREDVLLVLEKDDRFAVIDHRWRYDDGKLHAL